MSKFTFTPVRGAHQISPFGPGSLQVSQNGVCGVVCGPPVWLESLKSMKGAAVAAFDNQRIWDSHMEGPLGVERLIAPWTLSDDPGPKTDWFVPVARFPLYEYCLNYKCHMLHRRDASDYREVRCDKCTSGNKRKWATVQVPAVLACQSGHLADFPWSTWLHELNGSDCQFPDDLRFHPGSLPDQPTVQCASCSRRRTLQREDRFECPGERPWLPGLPVEECDRTAQVLERSSTAIYYPQTVSSLTVPPPGVDYPALVRVLHTSSAIRSQRRTYERDRTDSSIDEIVRLCAENGIPTNAAEVKRHLAALDVEQEEAEDRVRELDALLMDRPRPTDGRGLPDLIVDPQILAKYTPSPLIDALEAVSLIPRLREVRALTGFSRISPARGRPEPNYEQLWGRVAPAEVQAGDRTGWFPAYEVFGEGILFMLKEALVQQWENTMERMAVGIKGPMRLENDLRHYLLHSLSHTIMRAAAPYAGYPLPSLRERLYESDERLAFLIYTSAGDIQGTLGGLVDLGRPGRLEVLLTEAVDAIGWCTTDPVCFEGGIELGLRRTTAAGACNHCLLLPETSCERSNNDLDRAAIIGFHGYGSFNGCCSPSIAPPTTPAFAPPLK